MFEVGIGSLVVMLAFVIILFAIAFRWGMSVQKRKQDEKEKNASNARVIPGDAGGKKPNPPDGVIPGDIPGKK